VSIICLQETNVNATNAATLPIPNGWCALFNEHSNGHMKGVGILVDKAIIPTRGWLERIKDETANDFDLLVCRAGALMIISVYVHQQVEDRQAPYENLASSLLDALEGNEGPVVMGGDFNHKGHRDKLLQTMEGIGFTPLYLLLFFSLLRLTPLSTRRALGAPGLKYVADGGFRGPLLLALYSSAISRCASLYYTDAIGGSLHYCYFYYSYWCAPSATLLLCC